MGDDKKGLMNVWCVKVPYIQPHMTPTPTMKLAQTAAGVVRFQ